MLSIPPSPPAHVAVDGVIVRGHGVASGVSPDSPYPAGTIALQLPYFAARGLDLGGMHPATINVDIAPRSYAIRRPAHTFPEVRWTDLHGAETFSFVRCWLTRVPSSSSTMSTSSTSSTVSASKTSRPAKDVEQYPGWIYYPHPETKPMHKQPASVLEVLMPYVRGLTYGDAVTLTFDPDEITIVRRQLSRGANSEGRSAGS